MDATDRASGLSAFREDATADRSPRALVRQAFLRHYLVRLWITRAIVYVFFTLRQC